VRQRVDGAHQFPSLGHVVREDKPVSESAAEFLDLVGRGGQARSRRQRVQGTSKRAGAVEHDHLVGGTTAGGPGRDRGDVVRNNVSNVFAKL
jgi:hypothetical protein